MTDTPTSSTYRVHRRRTGYVHVWNDVVNDDGSSATPTAPGLSYRALGLLVYMLSRPEGWAFHRDQLARGPEAQALASKRGPLRRVRAAREGREAVAAALRELAAAGYYRAQRVQVERGRWAMVTEVTDTAWEWSS